ncbi:hypothetical protein PNOK_0762800 [Pyrrhoderma noxium]|uniref:Uncharacterized protein n=1 Tax=Pyrrhoderma noxium TaxID=2282107 RepID=A0A286UDA0_9AGAM|nr:hypothetical protein PNOK_0762800 [Pyrrhoderma noxium]
MLYLDEAGIISTIIQGVLYGYASLMFTLSVWFLYRRRYKQPLNYPLITAAFALFILSTAELIVNIVRLCQRFLNVGPFLPQGPKQYFNDVSEPTFVIKSCLYNAQTLILDGVVIHRAYTVWKKLYIIILPVMGWIALLVSSIGTNIALVTASTHSDNIFNVDTGRWITSVYSTTLATNLSATALLAYKIWTVNRRVSSFKSDNLLRPVLHVIIESGAIYSATITAALITFVIGSPGVYVLLDMISPIICIVFNMIIIRIGLTSEGRLPGMPQSTHQNSVFPGSRGRPSQFHTSTNPEYEMKSIVVNVSHYMETDTETVLDREKSVKSGTKADDTRLFEH